MTVAFDTNILIDAIADRNDYQSAQKLVMAVAEEKIRGIVSANTITDIYYILRKRLGDAKARESIWNLLTVFDVVEVNAEICATALGSPMKDFEDAVLAVCSKQAEADLIVTGDIDFLKEESAPIRVVTAQQVLDMINYR